MHRETESAESDEALLALHLKGRAGAFEALVRRHADGLLGYLVRMVADRGRAEDLFQETFVRVHRKAETFKTDQRFKTWLYAIATHAAIDDRRRTGRAPLMISLDGAPDEDAQPLAERLPDETPHPSEKLTADERRARIRAVLAELPPRQRATVHLAFIEGLPYPQVAQALGCSVGTVKTQVSRALATLARRLPHPEEDAP